MKKLTLFLTMAAVTSAGLQSATAGEREWATAGKVLTGVVAGSIIASAVTQHAEPVYEYSTVAHYYPAPVVYSRAVVTVPAPLVVRPAPVVVCTPLVVARPAPVISFTFGGGPYGHRLYDHHQIRGRGHWNRH